MEQITPKHEQHFDHFFYALQAAQDQLGMAIGSIPLVSDDLIMQRLIAPFGMQPTGYDYALLTLDDPSQDPRVAAFSNWLMGLNTHIPATKIQDSKFFYG